MELETCFVLILVLLTLTEVYGGAIVYGPRDVKSAVVGQRTVLNCTVKCSHIIQWRVNAESYRHLPFITTDHILDDINIKEVEGSFTDDSSMCKQSFEIQAVTPEWHEKSVQCIAAPKDEANTNIDYSMFATVYIDGIVDSVIPCPSSTMNPSSRGGGTPASTVVMETTSTVTSSVCMCATPSTSATDSVESVGTTSSAQPLSHISHLIFILISCYILL